MIGPLRAVVLDAPDIRRLAAFYTALAGWATLDADDNWITMETPDGWRVALQRSPGHVQPRWPDPEYPQQIHLDVTVDDIGAAETEALKLGATSMSYGGEDFRVFADPAGKPFCLCWD